MDKKYFAFISYSRKDKVAAEWLQKGMEHFRYPRESVVMSKCPPHKKFVRPIFLDKNELEVSSTSFNSDIERCLANSKYLIILCTPSSAHSPWVNAELEYFLKTHNSDLSLVLPIIADDAGVNAIFGGYFAKYKEKFLQRNLPDMSNQGGGTKKDAKSLALAKTLSYLLGMSVTQIHDRFKLEQKRKAHIFIFYLLFFISIITAAGGIVYKVKYEYKQASVELIDKAKLAEDEAEKRLIEAKTAQELAEKKAQEAKIAYIEAQERAQEAKLAAERSKQAEENAKKMAQEKQEAEKLLLKNKLELEKIKSQSLPFTPRDVIKIDIRTAEERIKGVSSSPTTAVIEYFKKDQHYPADVFVCISKVYEYLGYASTIGFLERYEKSDSYPNLESKILNLKKILISALEFNLSYRMHDGYVENSIREGMPIIVVFKRTFESIADKIVDRTLKRAKCKTMAEVLEVLSKDIVVAKGMDTQDDSKNAEVYAGIIYGFNIRSDEYVFYFKGNVCSLKKSELSELAEFFVFPALNQRSAASDSMVNIVAGQEGVQPSHSPASSIPEPVVRQFDSVAEKFKENVKKEDGAWVNLRSEPNKGRYYEIICDIFQYLKCNVQRDKVRRYANSGIHTSMRDSILNICEFFNYDWKIIHNWGFNDELVKISLNEGIPVLVSLKSFAKDKNIWDEITERKGVGEVSKTLKYRFSMTNRNDFSENDDFYALVYGYTNAGCYKINYLGVEYLLMSGEIHMLCRNLFLFKYEAMSTSK